MCKIQISETELRQLLGSEETAEEALQDYFVVDESSPFSTELRLKPDVEVIDKDVQVVDEDIVYEGRILDTVVHLANAWSVKGRHKRYRDILEADEDRLRLVSEGDSWFQHPRVKDTVDHLFNYFAIYSVGAAGDELSNMFRENEYLPALKNEKARGLLLSGGGNDLMGGRFGEYLDSYTPGVPGEEPRRFLNARFPEKVSQMMEIYRTIMAHVDSELPAVKVFVHGYDYVRPGRGKSGKWLGIPMEDKGIRDQHDKEALIKIVIDDFNEELAKVTADAQNAHFVDVRGTVGLDQWHDEIHPDEYGFQQVALKFFRQVTAAFEEE